MNNFVKSVLWIQSPSSGSSSCDTEYDDITVIRQKRGEVTWIMIHPGTGTHEEENKNWLEIKKKGREERRRNRLETLDPLTHTKQKTEQVTRKRQQLKYTWSWAKLHFANFLYSWCKQQSYLTSNHAACSIQKFSMNLTTHEAHYLYNYSCSWHTCTLYWVSSY